MWCLLLTGFLAGADLGSLQAAVDRNPTDATAWLELARGYETAGREADAIRAYTKAEELPAALEALAELAVVDDPAGAAALFRRAAQKYVRAGDIDRCRRFAVRHGGDHEVLSMLLQRDPPPIEMARELPELVAACGRRAEFAEPLGRWMAAWPVEPGPLAAWAMCSEEPDTANRLREQLVGRPASALVEVALARDYESVESVWTLLAGREAGLRAIVGALQKDRKRAGELLQAMADRPSRFARSSEYSSAYVVLFLGAQTDQLPAAEKTLRVMMQHRLRDSDVAGALLGVLERQGKFDAILELTADVVATGSLVSVGLAHRHRARAFARLGRDAEAVAAARAAVKTAPGRSLLAARLTQIEVEHWFGRKDAARALAKPLLEEHPEIDDERTIRIALATLAENHGEPRHAEAHLRRILDLAPRDPLAHNNLGYYLAEQRLRLAQAEWHCRIAVGQGREAYGFDPGGDDASYRDSLGWALFRQGRLIAAQREIERALRLPGGRTDAVIWDHYGDVLAARKLTDRARAAWTESLARMTRSISRRDDPRPAELRRKLAAGG